MFSSVLLCQKEKYKLNNAVRVGDVEEKSENEAKNNIVLSDTLHQDSGDAFRVRIRFFHCRD